MGYLLEWGEILASDWVNGILQGSIGSGDSDVGFTGPEAFEEQGTGQAPNEFGEKRKSHTRIRRQSGNETADLNGSLKRHEVEGSSSTKRGR